MALSKWAGKSATGLKITELFDSFRAFFVLPVVIGVVAALSSNPELFLPVFFLNVLLVFGLLGREKPRIRVELSAEPQKVKVGEEFVLRAKVTVRGGFGIILVKLPPHPGTEAAQALRLLEGTNVHLFFKGLWPINKTLEIRFQALKKGEYFLRKAEYVYYNVFGAIRPISGAVETAGSVTVLPQIALIKMSPKLRQREIVPRASRTKVGPPSTDFSYIREYLPGDPFKFINWKASARLNELMVNEYEREGSRTVILVVDRGSNMLIGTNVENALEYAVPLAATLARSFIRSGASVGLYGLPPEPQVYPSTGEEQFLRILRKLIALRVKEGFSKAGSELRLARIINVGRPFLVFITNLESRMDALRVAFFLRRLNVWGVVVDVVPDNLPLRYMLQKSITLPWTVSRQEYYRLLPKRFRVVSWDPAYESLGTAVVKVYSALRGTL